MITDEGLDPVDWEGLDPPYATIVADPPWPYDGGGPVGTGGRGAEGVPRKPDAAIAYSSMALDDLAAMRLGLLADADAHLYLWTTNAFMEQAHQLARAWGFHPKTILTWVKTHQNDPTRVSMKTGYYFRGATEHVVHGSLKLRTTESLPTAYLWPRIGQHSVKPARFYDLVEKASPGPYVELFARQPRLGWDHWGYGIESPTESRDDG